MKEHYVDEVNSIYSNFRDGHKHGVEKAFESFVERVEFYKKYKDNPISLKMDYPKFYNLWEDILKPKKVSMEDYRNWLFSYCFKELLKPEQRKIERDITKGRQVLWNGYYLYWTKVKGVDK